MADGNGELLNSLLEMLGENPEEKISAALQSLGAGEKESSEQVIEEKSRQASEAEAFDELSTLLKIGNLMSDVGGEDARTSLLKALKPFLSEEKRPKIDRAMKMLRLAKIAEAAGKSDLLKNLKL